MPEQIKEVTKEVKEAELKEATLEAKKQIKNIVFELLENALGELPILDDYRADIELLLKEDFDIDAYETAYTAIQALYEQLAEVLEVDTKY